MAIARQFWRGELGFLWVLVLLIGASLILTIASSRVPFWAAVPFVAVLALVSLVQIIGSVRFSERVMRDGALSRVYGAYATMGVAVLANGVCAIGLLLPQPEMSLEIDGFAPKVFVKSNVAEVVGEIDYQILTELKAAVVNADIQIVRLSSAGGNVIAGRSIGLFIAQNKLDTEVQEQCFSACTLAFAGGVKRVLGPNGVLGFHGYRVDDANRVQAVDWRGVIDKDRDYLAAQGVKSNFIDRIFETAPRDLWRPRGRRKRPRERLNLFSVKPRPQLTPRAWAAKDPAARLQKSDL